MESVVLEMRREPEKRGWNLTLSLHSEASGVSVNRFLSTLFLFFIEKFDGRAIADLGAISAFPSCSQEHQRVIDRRN